MASHAYRWMAMDMKWNMLNEINVVVVDDEDDDNDDYNKHRIV